MQLKEIRFGFSAALVLAASFGSALVGAEEVQIEAIRESINDATSDIILKWKGTELAAYFDIYVSDKSSAELNNSVAIAREVPASDLSWQTSNFDRVRPYFIITVAGSDQILAKTAVRLLPLEGGRNFRDIGGYRTEDGRVTKWGKVFRSGAMSGITADDYAFLDALRIQVVCDFRSVAERQQDPTDWKAGNIDYFSWDDVADVSSSVQTLVPSAEMNAGQMMAAGYPDYLVEHGEKYKQVLDSMLADEVPLAFNCSAGKDRAGMATALVLSVLGVPRDTIVHDYSLSDDYVDYMSVFASQFEDSDSPYHYLAQLPEDSLRALMASDPSYMEMALDEVERRYGSMQDFVRHEMGLSDRDIANLQQKLLE